MLREVVAELARECMPRTMRPVFRHTKQCRRTAPQTSDEKGPTLCWMEHDGRRVMMPDGMRKHRRCADLVQAGRKLPHEYMPTSAGNQGNAILRSATGSGIRQSDLGTSTGHDVPRDAGAMSVSTCPSCEILPPTWFARTRRRPACRPEPRDTC